MFVFHNKFIDEQDLVVVKLDLNEIGTAIWQYEIGFKLSIQITKWNKLNKHIFLQF